jgi:hypothetical protein
MQAGICEFDLLRQIQERILHVDSQYSLVNTKTFIFIYVGRTPRYVKLAGFEISISVRYGYPIFPGKISNGLSSLNH